MKFQHSAYRRHKVQLLAVVGEKDDHVETPFFSNYEDFCNPHRCAMSCIDFSERLKGKIHALNPLEEEDER